MPSPKGSFVLRTVLSVALVAPQFSHTSISGCSGFSGSMGFISEIWEHSLKITRDGIGDFL
jgi:hypothetical protein